jgi:hypothetical protein
MDCIEFTGSFGDEQKKIIISMPNGAGEMWFINIDGYYVATIFYRSGEWIGYDTTLTIDDIQIAGELIDRG